MHDKSSFVIDQVSTWTRNLAIAGAFLSRLPFLPNSNIQATDLSCAVHTFPLIGLLIAPSWSLLARFDECFNLAIT